MKTFPHLTIRPAERSVYEAALALVFRLLPADVAARHVAQLMAEHDRGGIDFSALWVAERETLVGAAWLQLLAGRCGVVHPPQLVAGEAESTADGLMQALLAAAAGQADVLQAILPRREEAAEARLRRFGFHSFTHLRYLMWNSGAPIVEPQATPQLTFSPASDCGDAELTALVEATYEGTLDCPHLNGRRQTADVLAGYRSHVPHRPELWLAARYEGEVVGCLLLADQPQQDQLELVYMGLAPHARGRGWGRELVAHTQRLAQRERRHRVVLAVDGANEPAMKHYRAAGFFDWDDRYVFMRFL